ncbi:hypothetical protein [Streptomyces sp. MST-110588]|nr:hypothetical protein [Streptomyces sp. MST-110588]UNO39511.1 hypothetical protein KGS77_07720 [Streptomyces sp. MST-110588]
MTVNVELIAEAHEDVFDLDAREVTSVVAPGSQDAAFTLGTRCELLTLDC